MSDEIKTANLRGRLHGLASVLGDDELRVLVRIAERLRQGQENYGSLDLLVDSRNWDDEAREELLDAIFYFVCAMEAKR